MQAQVVVHAGAGGSACRHRREHDEPDGNVLSRGEGAPSPAATRRKVQATRCKRLLTFVNYVFTFRFVAIMNCEYSFINPHHDGVDNFISSMSHYSKNTGCSLAEAFRELSLYAYKWLLNHFDKKKAHRIHRNVICHSLF